MKEGVYRLFYRNKFQECYELYIHAHGNGS